MFAKIIRDIARTSVAASRCTIVSSRCLTTGSTPSIPIEDRSEIKRVTDPNDSPIPAVPQREIECLPHLVKPQAWLESLKTRESNKLGIIDLHPDVFATFPRIDILQRNIQWQKVYKTIDTTLEKTRAECSGGGRKPWRQKGTGRARHGSIRSPIWIKGGKAIGARGGKTYWYVLPAPIRAWGLRIAMSIKHAQDNLYIVDSLDIPSSDPFYLEDIGKERYWGQSVLFVDDKPLEEVSENFMNAINRMKTYNILSTEGFNCWSILKHETLVMTLDAVNFLEARLMFFTKQYLSQEITKNREILYSQLQMNPHRKRRDSTVKLEGE